MPVHPIYAEATIKTQPWLAQAVSGGVLDVDNLVFPTPKPLGGVRTPGELARFSTTFAGHRCPSFVDIYYYRVLLSPGKLLLGNLLSTETTDISLWNAFPDQWLTLTDIDIVNNDGIEVVGIETPYVLNPLEELNFQVVISGQGTSVVAAQINFTIDDRIYSVSVSGQRVTVLPFAPMRNHKESIQFLTQVDPYESGEQRIALRPAPRSTFTYTYKLSAHDYARAKNILCEWSHRVFGVAEWRYGSFVFGLGSGAQEIPLDTTTADYRDNDSVLVFQSSDHFEVAQTANIYANRIALTSGVVGTYERAYVCPMRYGRLLSGASFNVESGVRRVGQLQFSVDSNVLLEHDYETVFNDYPVFTKRLALQGVEESFIRRVEVHDNKLAPRTVEVMQDYTRNQKNVRVAISDLTALWSVKTFLHAQIGRLKPFYLPTWEKDIFVIESISDVSQGLVCKNTAFNRYRGKAAMMLLLKNGQVFYRLITGSSLNDDGTETLFVGEAFGQTIPPDDIELGCYLNLMRLSSDDITIDHLPGGNAKVSFMVETAPDAQLH